jgi:hypothetical protein
MASAIDSATKTIYETVPTNSYHKLLKNTLFIRSPGNVKLHDYYNEFKPFQDPRLNQVARAINIVLPFLQFECGNGVTLLEILSTAKVQCFTLEC